MIDDFTFRRCSPEAGVKALSNSSFIYGAIIARFCSAVVILLIIMTANAGLAGAQTFALKFGSNGSGDGQFNAPQGVAVDGTGNGQSFWALAYNRHAEMSKKYFVSYNVYHRWYLFSIFSNLACSSKLFLNWVNLKKSVASSSVSKSNLFAI